MVILICCIRTSLCLSKLSISSHQMSLSKTVIIHISIWSTILICSIIISRIILTNFCQISNLITCKICRNLSLQSYSNWLPRCDLLSQCFNNFPSTSIRPTCIIKFKPIWQIISHLNILCNIISLIDYSNRKLHCTSCLIRSRSLRTNHFRQCQIINFIILGCATIYWSSSSLTITLPSPSIISKIEIWVCSLFTEMISSC